MTQTYEIAHEIERERGPVARAGSGGTSSGIGLGKARGMREDIRIAGSNMQDQTWWKMC